MDFNTLINEKIMPEVKSDSDEPIIIYRDKYGDWHGDFTRNQYGEEFNWVDDVRENNLFAVTVAGSDFYKKSFTAVYDEIFIGKLRAEYDLFYETETVIGLPYALISFIEDNISEIPQEVTDYLMELERPFSALIEMIPQNFKNDLNVNFPDIEKQDKLIDHIEKEVEKRLINRSKVVDVNRETENESNKIWLRLGISLNVPEEQKLKIMNGDEKALLAILTSPGKENGEWYIDGDTYIPENDIDEEVRFDLPIKSMTELIQNKAMDIKNDVTIVTDKSKSDISTLPKKQKSSLSERIEKGKEKVREADKNKSKSDKLKKHNKVVDD